MLLFFKIPLIGFLFYPVVLFAYFVFVLGLSFILASLGVIFRDLENIWRVLTRAFFWGSAIFYFIDPPKFKQLLSPLFYYPYIGRKYMIYNEAVPLDLILMATCISFSFLLLGLLFFNSQKDAVCRNRESCQFLKLKNGAACFGRRDAAVDT